MRSRNKSLYSDRNFLLTGIRQTRGPATTGYPSTTSSGLMSRLSRRFGVLGFYLDIGGQLNVRSYCVRLGVVVHKSPLASVSGLSLSVLATPPLNSLEELESNLKPECVDGNGILADRVDAAKPVVMAVRAAVPWPQKLIASGAMIVAAEGSRKSDKSTFLTEQSLDLLTNPIA